MLVLLYDSRRDVVAISQVPEDLPLSHPKGISGRCSKACKNLQIILKDSEVDNYFGAKSKQDSDEEDSHPLEETAPSDYERGEKLIPNLEL